MNSVNTSTEHYVIVGFGWVGQANALALKMMGCDVSYFDPGEPPHHYTEHTNVYSSIKRLSKVTEVDGEHTFYLVCVGDRVSEDGVQDISSIEKALSSLTGVRGAVILRSTIIPETLERLSFDFYMPEFLHEKKAVEECLHPYFFVLGRGISTKKEPSVFSVWRTRARKSFDGTPREASYIKYLSNLWNAVRIAFVNEFGDAIGRPTDKKKLNEIEDILAFLFDNRGYLRYGRSFGGHCLPKDTRAFMAWYGKNSPMPLLHGTYESNTQHAKLEKELPLIPEWFSEWPDRQISGQRALHELWYVVKKYATHPALVWQRITKGL